MLKKIIYVLGTISTLLLINSKISDYISHMKLEYEDKLDDKFWEGYHQGVDSGKQIAYEDAYLRAKDWKDSDTYREELFNKIVNHSI